MTLTWALAAVESKELDLYSSAITFLSITIPTISTRLQRRRIIIIQLELSDESVNNFEIIRKN